jgi:hypothetical protein
MSHAKRPEMERFWEKTKPDGACIVWIGNVNKTTGYGNFEASDPGSKRHRGFKAVSAHRFVYQRVTGYSLPSHILVMHSCDNRRCVSLQHLSHGSYKANAQDALNKGRLLRGEQRAIKLSDSQILEIRRLCSLGHPQAAVGELFNVHQVTISKIVLRKLWAHI